MNTIYTAGYQGHTPQQLKRAADKLDAVVIDIRYSPQSRIPGWSGAELSDLLGTEMSEPEASSYLWLKHLGNRSYLHSGMEIADLSRGLEVLSEVAKFKPCILLCGCADYETCHRKYIADVLKREGWNVQELEWPEITKQGTLKCLSLWQPWASLIAIGAKRIETRGWATAHRGPLVIHAAKRWTSEEKWQCGQKPFSDSLGRAELTRFTIDPIWGNCLSSHSLPLGAAVAVVNLVDCISTDRLRPRLSNQEMAFGNYSSGRYGFVLNDIRPLTEPVPLKGAQGFFNIDSQLLEGKY